MSARRGLTTARPLAAIAKDAAEAHTNLNLWGVIVAVLEGGTLYGGRGNATAQRIIKLCHAEQQRELAIYDAAAGPPPRRKA